MSILQVILNFFRVPVLELLGLFVIFDAKNVDDRMKYFKIISCF